MSDNELTPKPEQALDQIRDHTPARILVGRAGGAYTTSTQLHLREDHAFARDAVHEEPDFKTVLGTELVERYGLFEVTTQVKDKTEYLMRPDLGRQFNTEAEEMISSRCSVGCDIQIAIGDGLSIAAVHAQVPRLLPLLESQTKAQRWTFGQPFFIRYCRVGIMNGIGAILKPKVVILLIGERPGLATAESLSAYMAYRPHPGDTDAQRNLISNIHANGISPEDAAVRIINLAAQMHALQQSGTEVKETNLLPPSK